MRGSKSAETNVLACESHWPDCEWCNSSHVNSTNGGSPATAADLPAGQEDGGSTGDDNNNNDRDDSEMRRRDFVNLLDGIDVNINEAHAAGPEEEGDTSWNTNAWYKSEEGVINEDDLTPYGRSFNALSNFRRPVKRAVEETDLKGTTTTKSVPSFANLASAPMPQSIVTGVLLPLATNSHMLAARGQGNKPPGAAVTASRAAQAGADNGPQVSATRKPSSSAGPTCTVSSTYVAPTASSLTHH